MSAIAPAHRLTPVPQGRVTQLRVIRSEWTKLRSVRSTRWALFTGVLATIGIAALACAIAGHHYALVVLGIPPILASTYAGVSGVDRSTIDAARGMGMTEQEILTKVEIPIALPLIISGLRSATLQIVSTATVAAYVALGGLGRYVIDGLSLRDFPQMLTGAVLVALLAILLDLAFAVIARFAVSAGLTGRLRKKTDTMTTTAPATAEA